MTHLHENSTLLTPDTVLSHNKQFSLLCGAQAMVTTVSSLLLILISNNTKFSAP